MTTIVRGADLTAVGYWRFGPNSTA